MKCKMFLLKIMQEFLTPIRERRAMWEQRLPEVQDILRRGTEEAYRVGEATMEQVRHAMRIDYFNGGLSL